MASKAIEKEEYDWVCVYEKDDLSKVEKQGYYASSVTAREIIVLRTQSPSLHITFTVIFEAGYVNRLWRRMGCSRILEDTLFLHFRTGDLHITSIGECKLSNCGRVRKERINLKVKEV